MAIVRPDSTERLSDRIRRQGRSRMRKGGILMLGVIPMLLTGCFCADSTPSTSWLMRGGWMATPERGDAFQLETYLIETSLRDPFVEEELWSLADDQVVPLELKALLEKNGLRVAQVGGVAPAGLQALMRSPRSCPDPRRIQQAFGKTADVKLGPPLAQATFQVQADGATTPLDLHQAECYIIVAPTMATDGRIRLRCKPEVRHGNSVVAPSPSQDRTTWLFQKQQPTETFDGLAWEVTLGAAEYTVIGGRFDRPDSLGNVAFIRTQESPPRQRILVLRASRPGNPGIRESENAPDTFTGRTPPLAIQAAWTTARGSDR